MSQIPTLAGGQIRRADFLAYLKDVPGTESLAAQVEKYPGQDIAEIKKYADGQQTTHTASAKRARTQMLISAAAMVAGMAGCGGILAGNIHNPAVGIGALVVFGGGYLGLIHGSNRVGQWDKLVQQDATVSKQVTDWGAYIESHPAQPQPAPTPQPATA